MANIGNIATLSGLVLTDSGIDMSTKADLVNGLVPASQLPSYVDDILEYANLVAFPGTGETAKIYVALNDNKIYRWSGSAYIEVSPTVGGTWGAITGTLSNQTDLQAALDAKVPTARTLTINGTAYDLSADRSWTIAAGLTSFNTRTGDITLSSTDVTTALGYTPAETVNPSARTIQTFTATSGQATFTVTGGYVVGLIDVFINGIKLAAAEYTASNGSTVVLGTGTGSSNIVEIVKYTSALTMSNALRTVNRLVATANQTVFTVSYNPGLVDVFYNGSKLDSTEYTASNGTSITLTTAAALNDVLEVVAYSYAVGAFTGQAQLNGTGFVKVSGTTVSYDNTSYLPLTGGTLTGGLIGTSATFSDTVAITLTASDSRIIGGNSTGRLLLANSGTTTYGIFYGASHATLPNTISLITDNTERLRITNTGAATVYSSLTATQLLVNESSPKIVLTPLSYSGAYRTTLGTRSGAEGVLQFGNNGPNFIVGGNTGTGGALHFYVNATSDFITSTNGTLALVLAATGTATFSSSVTANRLYGAYSLVLNTFTTVNPGSNVLLMSAPNDRDAWIYLDQADTNSNWGIYHRQIDTTLAAIEGNSIAFIGASVLRASIGLETGNGYFAGKLTLNSASGSANAQGSLNFAHSPSNANSRSWRVSTDQLSWGDFAVQSSSTQTGAIANTSLHITKEGRVSFPAATAQNYGISNATAVTITNGTSGTIASCTITSVGKPIFINITGDINPIGGASWSYIQIYRNGSPIGKRIIAESTSSSANIPFAVSTIDVPGAGTHTYTGYASVNGASPIIFGETGDSQAPTILAIELL